MLRYPTDDDGYAKAIQIGDRGSLLENLNQYGICVIGEVLSIRECEVSIKSMIDELNEDSPYRKGKLDLSNPYSLESANFPGYPKSLFKNFAQTEQAFRNRVNRNIEWIYSTLYKTERLWTSVDVWGLTRPTIMPDGSQRKDWESKPLGLHTDHVDLSNSDHTDGKYAIFQSLVALVDCPEEVGGFCCVPGSANELSKWVLDSRAIAQARHTKPWKYSDGFWGKVVPAQDEMQKRIQRVPLRQGHFVIWDSRTAHGNFSGHSAKARIVQYIRMQPATSKYLECDYGHLPMGFFDENPEIREEMSQGNWTLREKRLLSLVNW